MTIYIFVYLHLILIQNNRCIFKLLISFKEKNIRHEYFLRNFLFPKQTALLYHVTTFSTNGVSEEVNLKIIWKYLLSARGVDRKDFFHSVLDIILSALSRWYSLI